MENMALTVCGQAEQDYPENPLDTSDGDEWLESMHDDRAVHCGRFGSFP